jgi:hypothetical protein
MAIFHDIRRPRSFDEAIRSGDSALNFLIVLLLIAFGLATWYFYATPMADRTTASATITAPATPNTDPVKSVPAPTLVP